MLKVQATIPHQALIASEGKLYSTQVKKKIPEGSVVAFQPSWGNMKNQVSASY